MIRCGCMLLAGALVLIAWGCQGIFQALAHGKRTDTTYAQLVSAHTHSGWFRVTDGVLDLSEAVWKDSATHEIEEAYVPLKGLSDLKDKPVHLLVLTKDPEVLSTLKQWNALPDNDEKQAAAFLKANLNKMLARRPVDGMMQEGIDSDSKTREAIAKKNTALDPDYVILEEGARPSMAGGIGKLVGGVLLLLVVGFFAMAQKNRS